MAPSPARVQVRRAAIPIFRKIFRKRGLFVCGICRSSYDSLSDANNCLNFCWFELQEHYPLIRRRDHKTGQYNYRCQYCARDYKSEYAGLECARLCVEQRNQKHIHEQLISELPLEVKRKHPVRLVQLPKQDAGGYVTKSPLSRKATDPLPNAEPSVLADDTITQAEPDSIVPAADASPEATVATPTAEEVTSNAKDQPADEEKRDDKLRRRKDSFPKSWIRKDAKYQCCCCLKKYFTKMEVEECFEGHFDDEGYEILSD